MRANQIICGDNVEVLSGFPDACIDLTVTSPPYGELRTYGGHSWDFEGVAQQLWRVTKPGGVVVWVVADQTIDGSESGESFRQALRFKEIGFRLHDTMIWDKGCFADVGSTAVRYGPVWEFMFIFSKGTLSTFNRLCDRKNKHHGAKIHGTVKDASGIARGVSNNGKLIAEFGIRFNIWSIPPDKQSSHVAPFPTSLARDHILSWSNPGDIVLDPFCGSGTTTRKAKDLGRKWIGIEVNPEYIDIINRRMAQEVLPFSDDEQSEYSTSKRQLIATV